METELIEHFMDGLNQIVHPTMIKNTEAQVIENFEVRPTSVADTLTYLALTARGSYKRLHSDALPFPARNLIEFVQRVAGGSGAGSKFLVTGGFDSVAGQFKVRSLADGASTTSDISGTASSDTGLCEFVLMNQYLFYTNGALAWRKWDGVTDSASGFTTITKCGTKHKNRIIYGNDVTNGVPNRLWVSDVGLPESVGASNFFDIGDRSDPIISLSDQIERILVVKEKSTWAFYLAPILTSSSILRADEYKGSVAPRGVLWATGNTFVYTTSEGIQEIEGLQYGPSVIQLMNFLKGFQNTLANLGYREDQLLIATYANSSGTYNTRVFIYDSNTKKVYQFNMNISTFCMNRGVTTFSKRLKACEDDNGSNRYIVEMEAVSSQVETNIACVWKSKKFWFKDPGRYKFIDKFTLDINAPNTTNAVTLKTYGDGTLVNTQTWTPSATGLQRNVFKFDISVVRGRFIEFQIEYTQSGTSADKFALLSAKIEYDFESRAD